MLQFRTALPMVACAAMLAVAGGASAQAGKAGSGLNGMWLIKPDDFGRGEAPPFSPASKAAADKARKATEEQGQVLSDASRKCLPISMPRFMMNEFALEILETPGRVTLLSEASTIPRTVYLGRKEHTADFEPGWNGHSIGHWEGQTLVIDTVKLNDRISHVPRGQLPSGQTHIVERLHVEDGGKTLVNQMTFTDPVELTAPYTVTVHYDRMAPDSELWEYACETNAEGWSERFANDPDAAKAKP